MPDINLTVAQYLKKLSVPEEDRQTLFQTRKIARKILREAFPGAKFLTQGSQQYKTANRPYHPPEQQVDLDDGMYLSDPLLEKYDLTVATILSEVENCLKPHVLKNAWKSVSEKKSCVRIELADDMHMDIPCYRVDKFEFEEFSIASHVRSNDDDDFYQNLRKISSGKVQLARDRKWENSDPRTIIDWVLHCQNAYGDRYIKICRIMKGWRDCQWQLEKSPLSSIMLMAMVANGLEESGITCDTPEKDDAALFQVVSKLKSILQNGVEDPDDSTEGSLSDELSPSEKNACISKFEALKEALKKAIDHGTKPADCIAILREQFGKFFPNDPSMIIIVPPPGTSGGQPPGPYATTMPLETYRDAFAQKIFSIVMWMRIRCGHIWPAILLGVKFLSRSWSNPENEED